MVGFAECPKCDDQPGATCPACGGARLAPLIGPARLRGALWAERVVKALVSRWPRWLASERALGIATRHVADLSRDPVAQAYLARECCDAAGKRYQEMIDYLVRRRLELPDRKT